MITRRLQNMLDGFTETPSFSGRSVVFLVYRLPGR